MGIRTRGLDIKAGATRLAADKTARAEAQAVIERWNGQLGAGRDMLWSPTIRARHGSTCLPRVRDRPRDRSPYRQPPPARLGRHNGARPARLVSRVGAYAEATGHARAAASSGNGQ